MTNHGPGSPRRDDSAQAPKKAPCATEDAWGFVIREVSTGYFFFAVFFFAAFLAGAGLAEPALAAARFSSMAA